MLDLIFIAAMLVCFGFAIYFSNWCDRQISK